MITSFPSRAFRALKRYSCKPYYFISPPKHANLSPLNFSEAPGNPRDANKIIYESIISGKSFLASRLGAVEARACARYYINNMCDKKTKTYFHLYQGFAAGYPNDLLNQLAQNAGVFPVQSYFVDQFCSRYLHEFHNIDLLGSFNPEESLFIDFLSRSTVAGLYDIEPFFADTPWTLALKDKKVLVVHPFAKSISYQYANYRKLLFENKDILPDFDLILVKSVQSVRGEQILYGDWFQALQYMIDECSKLTFDVAIIGCGAYGLPLAAALKNMNKPVIHLGGVTQILFGVRGKRWNKLPVSNYFNTYWKYPYDEETPTDSSRIENACYWQ